MFGGSNEGKAGLPWGDLYEGNALQVSLVEATRIEKKKVCHVSGFYPFLHLLFWFCSNCMALEKSLYPTDLKNIHINNEGLWLKDL